MRQYFGEHRSKFGLRELWRSLHGTNAALDHFEQRSPRGRAVWYWPNRPFVISKQATVTDSLMATADREPTSEPCRFPPSGTSLSPLGPSSPPLGPFLLDSGGRGERRPGRPPAFLESRRGLSVIPGDLRGKLPRAKDMVWVIAIWQNENPAIPLNHRFTVEANHF
jgi:hypothetical protein